MSAPPRGWHARSAAEVARELGVDPALGLTAGEAARRLAEQGHNQLQENDSSGWMSLLARQVVNILSLVLVAAAALSVAVGETTDAVTIIVIVVLNAVLGFVQEWRAERALAALRNMLAPRAVVVRAGRADEVDARELVTGDVVVLGAGDRIPADLRVIDERGLETDEASLTGESASVDKHPAPVADDAPLAERASMAWMGTTTVSGRGHGIVVATGMATELGRVATLTSEVRAEVTPLARRLGALGVRLGAIAIIVSVLVAAAGWWAGKPADQMLLTAISLAVAAIPEGLPAVVTITLALGVRQMARRRALVRRLPAAETLGAATVICTDKTGTLTAGEMAVVRAWVGGGDVAIDGPPSADLLALARTGALCNHAELGEGDQRRGAPTELALLELAVRVGAGVDRDGAVDEVPFDGRRKRMTVVERTAGGAVAHVKGAPEVVLARCTHVLEDGREVPLDDESRARAAAAQHVMAVGGLRTLALARRTLDHETGDPEEVERDLTLLGIVGLIDPPRAEVPEAVRRARLAGIRVIMITGDAAATALAVARDIGIDAERAVTGPELDTLDDDALRALLAGPVAFARVTPEHKLRIVRALQATGEIVAMTGDGVNDAPALKRAEIGVAMGKRGTDVARGAADMVLTDDNFSSIVAAVEEGRRQYDNIQKFVRYLLASNLGEVIAILASVLSGAPLVLLPIQILWINLVTDGVNAIALGLEQVEDGTMTRPPRRPDEPVLSAGSLAAALAIATYIGAATMALFFVYLSGTSAAAVTLAQTVAFSGIILLEEANVLSFRSLRAPMSRVGWWSNPWLIAAVGAMVALQVAAVYVPPLQRVLHTAPLGLQHWAVILLASAPLFLVPELVKIVWWRRASGGEPLQPASPARA